MRRKLPLLIALLLAASPLIGCEGRYRFGDLALVPKLAPTVPEIDKRLTKPCAAPVDISAEEVNVLWAKDRASLVKCARGQKALVHVINDRDRRMAGK